MDNRIGLFAMVFGTNLFYYVVTEFGMSHFYSFTAITWLCYLYGNISQDRKQTLSIHCLAYWNYHP